jgi:hypothetical protein
MGYNEKKSPATAKKMMSQQHKIDMLSQTFGNPLKRI